MTKRQVVVPHDQAEAEARYQTEFFRREQAENWNRELLKQNDALKTQLRAAAKWAEISGNRSLLRVMWEALQ